eukprot:EG_transcript_13007
MFRSCSACQVVKDRDVDFRHDAWVCDECFPLRHRQPPEGSEEDKPPTETTGANAAPAAAAPPPAAEGVLAKPDRPAAAEAPTKPTAAARPARRQVGVRSVVSVRAVDAVAGEITAELAVFLHYDSPKGFEPPPPTPAPFQRLSDEAAETLPPVRMRIPDTVESDEVSHTVLLSNKSGRLYEIRRWRLKLREMMELECFPFDRQIMKLRFVNWTCDFVPWSAPADDCPHTMKNDPALRDSDAAAVYEGTEWTLEWVELERDVQGVEASCIIRWGMSRNPNYYLWNFVLVIFVVVQLSTLTAAIDHQTFNDRAGLTYTLLLTYIAFQFVASSFIPRISYLTYMDKYVSLGMFMLVLLILENYFVSRYHSVSPGCSIGDSLSALGAPRAEFQGRRPRPRPPSSTRGSLPSSTSRGSRSTPSS